jgi:hypothetical protein
MKCVERKLSGIQEVQTRYIGGFINAHHAMSLIDDIFKSKCIESEDAAIIISDNAETI